MPHLSGTWRPCRAWTTRPNVPGSPFPCLLPRKGRLTRPRGLGMAQAPLVSQAGGGFSAPEVWAASPSTVGASCELWGAEQHPDSCLPGASGTAPASPSCDNQDCAQTWPAAQGHSHRLRPGVTGCSAEAEPGGPAPPSAWAALIPRLILHMGGRAGNHSPKRRAPLGRGGPPHEPEGVFADVHQAPQRLHGLVGCRRDVRELGGKENCR